MGLWMVRAGRHGEQEQGALSNGVVAFGWNKLSDLAKVKDKAEIRSRVAVSYSELGEGFFSRSAGQIWRFMKEIQKGDLVVLPLKSQSLIAIGEVQGEYEYRQIAENIKHVRRINWLKQIPRSAFDQDLLYSFGSLLTVCKIERNDAENRVKKILKGEFVAPEKLENEEVEVETSEKTDIEVYAKDEIIKHIGEKFKGHALPRLVDAILKAQGYITKVSPEGPDGGVDILAAAGPLGFDAPSVCVQVKSSSSPVDVKILRELQGVMSKVRANNGLLVSWGGFNNIVNKEAKDAFFSIRLWDQGELLNQIFKYYDKFDDELKAELPLKRIWGLVIEE